MNLIDPPFIYGAQYYRAPTPEPECWETDLGNMRNLGFNAVKFWVQWRWSERREGEYYWNDLDRLMDLAHENGLSVTLNLILDVVPGWIFRKYPDCVMIDAAGHQYHPTANICRQLGGYPGPCYHHPGALMARQRFVIEAVKHFAAHPALAMWDVWNEPENNLMTRTPSAPTLLCHCHECSTRFIGYLQRKYRDLTQLNQVWGRCYPEWNDVEVPTDPATISDFIDWREFHLDKLTAEADWRLETVKVHDPTRLRYLHVVANAVNCFNAVTCVDDFDLARNCQVFGSTMMSSPLFCAQAVSAARGKVFYNAECHINFGSTAMHQRIVDRSLFLKEILPQLGWGVRGVLFWQYRAETLGMESPAWGLVRPDGSPRPITEAAKEFWQRFQPFIPQLMECRPEPPAIGIWRGRRNEIFQFAIGQLKNFASGLEHCARTLYRLNLPFRTIASRQLLEQKLDGLKVLLLPDTYFMDDAEAAALNTWVRKGGIVIADAHLAGYSGTTGRHSRVVPGCGLAEAWGVCEEESTSSFHLPLVGNTEKAYAEAQGDVAKALRTAGASGAEYFPLILSDGTAGLGARRFAVITGNDLTIEATFNDQHCAVSKTVGQGRVFYAGTSLGQAAAQDATLLRQLLLKAVNAAKIERVSTDDNIHIDVLSDTTGQTRFVILQNFSEKVQEVSLSLPGNWHGLFSGRNAGNNRFSMEPDEVEFFYKIESVKPVTENSEVGRRE